jgi:hypothetical protein
MALVSFRFFIVGFRPVGTNEEGGRNCAATNQALPCSSGKKERLVSICDSKEKPMIIKSQKLF